MARANGEGTVYDTVQRVKRKFNNTKMCDICAKCTNKEICNNRTTHTICSKCQECQNNKLCVKKCDRFYFYDRNIAQITTDEGRKTVGTGKTKKEASSKKKDAEDLLERNRNIKDGKCTLSETMRKNEKEKLKLKLIVPNTYLRNIETIASIEKHPNSNKTMANLTEDDIKNILATFVEQNISQSQLEKIYDAIRGAFTYCRLDTINEIKRNTFVSNVEAKEVTAFTVDEEKKLLDYINKNQTRLVASKNSIDSLTVKNIIKFNLATAMRIGEICALNKSEDIDRDLKRVIVHQTLTKDEDKKIIVGSQTKTGRKAKRAGKKDTRYVPFNVLFDENDFIDLLDEQCKISSGNTKNSLNLLFCTKEGGFISHTTFNNIFKRICREAGIKLELTTGCNTHMMKHTGVTRMIENGISLEVISSVVGTSAEVLRENYAHILDDFIEREIKKSIKRRNKNLSLQ